MKLARVMLTFLSRGEARPRTHARSMLVDKWILTAEYSLETGDEIAWRAIVAALTSPAVARLEKTWRRVEDPMVQLLRDWSVNPSVGVAAVLPPRSLTQCIQCASTQSAWISEELSRALDDFKKDDRSEPNISVQPLLDLYRAVSEFSATLKACTPTVDSHLPKESQNILEIFDYIRTDVVTGQT